MMQPFDTRQLLTGCEITGEDIKDKNIRPQRLDDYIGQDKVRAQVAIFIAAARARHEALDHVLLFGPPGLGKTTLARIIAQEMAVSIRQTSGPVLEKPAHLAALLTQLEPGSVLFIDEIHRLSPVVEEILYPGMEDCQLDIMIGEGPSAQSIKIDLPPFTLIGATTRAGLLTAPLRDRFGIIHHLEFYEDKDLSNIIKRSAKLLHIAIDSGGTIEIARRSRGTPRIANRLLRRTRDYAQVKASGCITAQVAQEALRLLHVDPYGLDVLDRRFLLTLIDQFLGGPVGIESLSAALNEQRDTLEDLVEPFLIRQGLLMRTARGRMATQRAYHHFERIMPQKFKEKL